MCVDRYWPVVAHFWLLAKVVDWMVGFVVSAYVRCSADHAVSYCIYHGSVARTAMILYQSFRRFQERYPTMDVLEHVRDSKGVYALRISNRRKGTEGYFAAKDSQNGLEVSIHKDLLFLMRVKNRPLILGMGDHLFYMFRAADIERQCRENVRNGVKMVNFPLNAGKSLQTEPVVARKQEKLEVLKKLFDLEFVFGE